MTSTRVDSPRRSWNPPKDARASLERAAWVGLWFVVGWVVLFWRRGAPSFWDPDEATYALASREMLRTGQWLVPSIDGRPFFDKPILFYLFQAGSFAVFGPTERAARLVPALAAIPILVVTAWAGRTLFSRDAGRLAPIVLAVLPATFALSSLATLDMLFTASLFSAVALLVVSVVRDRPRLQWAGYLLLVPAILTKGPLALVLPALAFLVGLAHRELRPRLAALHWFSGPLLAVTLAAPWFLWMWWRFGDAFTDGYLLSENLALFTKPLYRQRLGSLNYLSVVAVGLLPWTPVLAGRLLDRLRGRAFSEAEFLLGAWVFALVLFFSISRFKLDHYVYPAAPALCLMVAAGWDRVRQSPGDFPATAVGVSLVGIVQIGGGCYMLFGLIPELSIDVSGWIYVIPVGLILGGMLGTWDLARRGWVPRRIPVWQVAALLALFSTILTVAEPAIEQARPVKAMALAVREVAAAEDLVAGYRMNRWWPSWRFYLDRPSERLENAGQLRAFFQRPGAHYCIMREQDWTVAQLAGVKARVLLERRGLMMTSGRGLRGGTGNQARFVVVTDAITAREVGR